MTAIRPVVLATLVILGGITLAVPAAGTVVADALQEQGDESDAPPMGSQVSAFMQSSASATGESVETEMFVAEYESADNETRPEIVEQRAKGLEKKLDRLRTEYADLLNESDEIPDAKYDAQVARLAAQIDALERAINETEPRAAKVGVDTAPLEELRTNASELSGPEVAEIARGLAGVEPPRGPPDHAGPGSERGQGNAGNATDGNPGNGGNATDSNRGDAGNATAGEENDGETSSSSDDPGRSENVPGRNDGSSGGDDDPSESDDGPGSASQGAGATDE